MKLLKWFRTQWRKVSYGGGGLMVYENMYGKFYVKYKDGAESVKMSWGTATEYAEMFNGEVKEID